MGALRVPLLEGVDSMRNLRGSDLPASFQGRQAVAKVKDGKRITAVERLEIYRRQYWFRITESLREDFEGVSIILGEANYHQLVDEYLKKIPSRCWTLKGLGKYFSGYIARHRDQSVPTHLAARNMAELEWAMIESFDAAEHNGKPFPQTEEEIARAKFYLTPSVRLVRASFPLDRIFALAKKGGRKPLSLLLKENQERYFAVYRTTSYQVRCKEMSFVEYSCLQQFATKGVTLGDAITALPRDLPEGELLLIHFKKWFASWKKELWLECRTKQSKGRVK